MLMVTASKVRTRRHASPNNSSRPQFVSLWKGCHTQPIHCINQDLALCFKRFLTYFSKYLRASSAPQLPFASQHTDPVNYFCFGWCLWVIRVINWGERRRYLSLPWAVIWDATTVHFTPPPAPPLFGPSESILLSMVSSNREPFSWKFQGLKLGSSACQAIDSITELRSFPLILLHTIY